MKKEVLLISRGMVFMVNTIIKNLEEEGLSVINVPPDILQVSANIRNVDIVMMYLGTDTDKIGNVFQYIRETMSVEKKYLCLMGSASDLDIARRRFPKKMITVEMERPVDVGVLLDELLPIIAADEGVSENELLQRKRSVLLVDDDTTFLKTLRDWMSPYYRVTIVNSGMQAIIYLASAKPDVILLDYDMPVTPGPKVLEMIRSERNTADLPVFFLTGKNDRDSVLKVLSLRPEGYLLKSTGRDALLKKLDEFFENR